jgi:hypothetical protein
MIHITNLMTLQQPLVQEAALQDGVVAVAPQADGCHRYCLSLSGHTHGMLEAAARRAPYA